MSNEGEKSYFDGGLLQFIGWSILGSFISIITLGIGLPWAVCMIQNWKVKHTVINNRRLKFNGTGGQLFGNYIKWFLLTLITFGIYSFWLNIKMKQWVVKHTEFNDGEKIGESEFDGGLLGLLGHQILAGLLTLITLGIGYPWAVCILKKWEITHTTINGNRLSFNGTGGQLFGNYIKWLLLTIITFGIYGLWLNIKMIQWVCKHQSY